MASNKISPKRCLFWFLDFRFKPKTKTESTNRITWFQFDRQFQITENASNVGPGFSTQNRNSSTTERRPTSLSSTSLFLLSRSKIKPSKVTSVKTSAWPRTLSPIRCPINWGGPYPSWIQKRGKIEQLLRLYYQAKCSLLILKCQGWRKYLCQNNWTFCKLEVIHRIYWNLLLWRRGLS